MSRDFPPTSWNLPPGVTDRDIDEASPGYWDEPPTEADELADEIDRLMQKAESGEDWAHICRLEQRLVALRGES